MKRMLVVLVLFGVRPIVVWLNRTKRSPTVSQAEIQNAWRDQIAAVHQRSIDSHCCLI